MCFLLCQRLLDVVKQAEVFQLCRARLYHFAGHAHALRAQMSHGRLELPLVLRLPSRQKANVTTRNTHERQRQRDHQQGVLAASGKQANERYLNLAWVLKTLPLARFCLQLAT